MRVRARATTTATDHAALAALVAARLASEPSTGFRRGHVVHVSEIEIAHRCSHCGSSRHGQPYVAAPLHLAGTVHVSLSRAGTWLALAVSRTGPVGIDLEEISAVRRAGFDDVAFNPTERAELALLDTAAADHARAVFWTRKEALLKLTGDGLRVDPRELTASLWESAPLLWPRAPLDMTTVQISPVHIDPVRVGDATLVGTLVQQVRGSEDWPRKSSDR